MSRGFPNLVRFLEPHEAQPREHQQLVVLVVAWSRRGRVHAWVLVGARRGASWTLVSKPSSLLGRGHQGGSFMGDTQITTTILLDVLIYYEM